MIELTVSGLNRPALVDADRIDLVGYRWRVDRFGYVFRHGDRRIMLHHEVLPLQPDEHLVRDHINRDKLDNRRANLRWLTCAESTANRGPTKRNRTSFRGVRYCPVRRQFLARVQMNGKAIVRRWFSDAVEANEFLVTERRRLMPWVVAA